MCKRQKFLSGRKFKRLNPKCVFYFQLIVCVAIMIPCVFATGASSQGILHRHRHGDDYPKLRSRRFGRETQAPAIVALSDQARVTAYPTYRIEDTNRGQQNLNKPNFVDCANYRPETLEGQIQGTKVIQIEAIDNDPKESGGTVTYSIVSNDQTQDAFAIDPNTGWLTTKKSFDRDEPTREKEIYVTVRATDNGRPSLDAVCTLKVKISDINDNKPMFDKYEYKESVPRDLDITETVMRISATDIDDGYNGTILYSLKPHPSNPSDIDYFEIVPQSGEVKLKKLIDAGKSRFFLTAVASDRGIVPQTSETPLIVDVVGPDRKPPSFITNSQNRIQLKETHKDKTTSILRIEATANSVDGILFFELISGQTEPTNKGKVFTLEQQGNVALLKLEKDLDYEAVSEYTLTIRAWNKYNLAAETFIKVEIEDENDEKPTFQEVYTGSVLENEPAGTPVMRVRAIDLDGTSPNNLVTLHLVGESQSNFSINSTTGDITTRIQFDREERDIYQLTVIARDGAPSAFPEAQGQPNERPVTLRIEIADKNDNKPTFLKAEYQAEIDENSNLGAKVIEVKAIDKDEKASILTYTITEGNVGDVFAIEYPNSGNIVIKNNLDYEERREYTLTIRASDGLFDDIAIVKVNVINMNDNPPKFEAMETNITIQEETVPTDCQFRVKAYDPDIQRNEPQEIAFFIQKGEDHFSVNSDGCVKVIKPLDRDHPHGYPWKQVRVGAKDEWGNTSTSLVGYIDLTVTLLDINDNAPFLNCTNPMRWDENLPPGRIIVLTAEDYDSEVNGPPFTFTIDPAADLEIKTYFQIRNTALYAEREFDREQRKQYLVPVVISDSGVPSQTGTSTLTVIIGDENDNDMKSGSSKIFVYKYKQNSTFTIGRVYVEDPDDWDLPDKTFTWDNDPHPQFKLDSESGDINMKPTTAEGVYSLRFEVYDAKFGSRVKADVQVTVKQIPEEAVVQSGSIRFMGITKEQFIKLDATGKSKQDKLRTEIAKLFPSIPEENVDVFTVINSPHIHDLSVIDVRFSAHGSPYYKSEKLDGIIGQNKDVLERALQLNIMMIRIDECISEKQHCEASCTNELVASQIAYKISTNTSSFVGVNAYVNPECKCAAVLAPDSCDPNPCLNGGICRAVKGRSGFTCECLGTEEGPRCEETSVAFQGSGYAWYKPLSVCDESSLDVQIITNRQNGLIMYNGPTYKSPMNISDFVSIELKSGHPILLIDYGSGVTRIELLKSPNLADGKSHKIALRWSPRKVSMQVDTCERKEMHCYNSTDPEGTNSFLNVNGPLQLGGISFRPSELRNAMNWNYVPTTENFGGCISNLTFNGQYYNLGNPSYSLGNVSSCDSPWPGGVINARLGVDFNFIIILLVCILILFILVIAIVFYRRRRSYQQDKCDPHDDVRENIINYSDEGGGEGDQTGYDLSVLMKPTTNDPFMLSPTEKIPMNAIPTQSLAPEPGEGPDIQSFLQGNKNKVDNDPDGLPYDDVRNYAYEGDGNSMGSLSSLASGTDDGDLNFDYLPTFGPRFKKLADMYGGQSSDDESYSGAPPEAWC